MSYLKKFMTNKISFISIFLLFFFKIAAISFTEFNLFPDEAQYWLWSQTLDFGYYSKPPLLAWFIAGYTKVLGSSFISLKIFPIIIYFFISFAVYGLCLKLKLSKNSSVTCSLTFLILPAVSLSSFLVSTDLLLLFFWIISMILILQIRNLNSILNFVLLGFFLGLAFLAKYAAVYFLLCLFVLLILDKKTYMSFKKNPIGVIFFIVSFLIVFSPNFFWNLSNGWITLTHTSENANLKNLKINFYEPLKFISSQMLMVGPVIIFSSILLIKNFIYDFRNKFLLIFLIPIFLIILIESLLVRANANWAAPALISLFILLFRFIEKERPHIIKLNFIVNYIIAMILFGCIFITSKYTIFDRIRGINIFSIEVLSIINDKDLAISDRMVFSSLSYEFRKKNNQIYMPYQSGSVISNHFQTSSSLSKDMEIDFFFIGEINDISYLSKSNQINLIKEFNTPFSSSNLKLYEVIFK